MAREGEGRLYHDTLESKRAEVAMEAREVREVSSTWRLRECGEVFGRM